MIRRREVAIYKHAVYIEVVDRQDTSPSPGTQTVINILVSFRTPHAVQPRPAGYYHASSDWTID
jgi:hypothetical protein